MSNARIQFSLADESVWQAYNPQLKEGEIVTVVKPNKKIKLVQGKIGGSAYIDSTIIWDEDEAEALMNKSEAAANAATAQAQSAESSANSANSSATAAASSATAAKTSESNAASSAAAAKNSETAAKNSASSAATSATAASTAAGRASDSATAAAGSATQADNFASTATAKATAADKSATAADKSATAADKSATAAAASAITASDEASAAASSATAAASSATSAAGSATAAEGLVSKAAYGFLQRNTAYAVGDIAYSEQLPAGYYLECVTAGITGNTEPTFNVGGVTLDGSAEWSVQVVASNAAVETKIAKKQDNISDLIIQREIRVATTDQEKYSYNVQIPVFDDYYLIDIRVTTQGYVASVYADWWLSYKQPSNISFYLVSPFNVPTDGTGKLRIIVTYMRKEFIGG